jgi:superfamily II DNA or RNA helicase
MDLREAVTAFLSNLLEGLSYHPVASPYLKVPPDFPIQPYLHQYEIVARLSLRRPVRALIGDEIGLGKTITAIALAKHLERIGRVRRALIVVPRVLVSQWRKELSRMGIPDSKVMQIESYTLDFLKSIEFPEGYYIASMDFLKRERRIGEVLNVPWDLIIVDEVHKFGYKTKRFWRIGKMLVEGKPERNVLFLSATPHRGDPKDYLLRLRLLDPYLTEGWRSLDNRQFYEATHSALLFRRTKEDINKVYEEKQVFPPARFYAVVVKARDDEAEFVRSLVDFLRSKLVEFAYEKRLISEEVIPLLVILIFKRATSSPYAAWTTLERLLIKRAEPEFPKELIDSVRGFLGVGFEDYEYGRDPEEVFNEFLDRTSSLLTHNDIEQIKMLRDAAKSVMEKGDTKLNALTSFLEDVMAEEKTKVIVFTEYKDTADYLINYLTEKRHPEWKGAIRRLTSEETFDVNKFRKVKDEFEKDPRVRILVATDVVAEGVNLQVANVLVNYEIPWSLIKLEQRVGRVWRLGQTKDVEAYTLFMSNVADMAALRSMYGKLINLRRALGRTRPIIGQEVVYYAEAEDLAKIPLQVAMVETAKRRKFLKVTEGRAIQAFIKGGEAGLESLVASIIAARNELEREIESKGVLCRPRTKREIEQALKPLGFKNPSEFLSCLQEVVKAACKIYGYKVFEGEGFLRVARGTEMPVTIATIDQMFSVLTPKSPGSSHCCLVAYGEKEDTVVIFPVDLMSRKDGTVIYRELVGLSLKNGQILRGPLMMGAISQALYSCIGVEEFNLQDFDMPLNLTIDVIDEFTRSAAEILSPLDMYTNKLKGLKLRDADKTFLKASELDVKIQKPICLIRFVRRPISLPASIPEELKREVEEKSIQYVMEFEKSQGRIPVRVPEAEHYDIKSVELATGDVRFIEVKGHYGPEVFGELTEEEAKLAREKGEAYWLYIVYDVGSEEPKLLRFKDPFRTMNWEVFEKVERRFILWPKS